jgi:NAD(P)-dependent dehydrogenase (short-subunit alcohol dehydrogenase family)
MSRVALITGGAQGIGAGAARKLLREGFRVVLLDRNEARLQQEAATLSKLGQVEIMAADLCDDATPAKAVSYTIEKFNQLDVLINAAGSTARGNISNVTLESYHTLFDVNVKAPLFMMQAAAKVMKAGTIINVASMIAYGGPPHLAAYSASKAALVALTKHAAQEYAWAGIRSFCINLGWAFTEGEQAMQTKFHGLPEDWSATVGAEMPSGRLILPEDIADLVAYLVSPSAQMMNGAVIDFEQMPEGMFRVHPALRG